MMYDFKDLCVSHYPDLVNFALRLTSGNRALALDVVQDSLERALANWAKWAPSSDEPSRSARAWLYRIVANTFASEYKRGKVQRRITDTSITGEVMEATTNCVVEYVGSNTNRPFFITPPPEDNELGHEIQEALGRVKAEYREMVELVFLHGMTTEDASKHLGIPFGTARSRLERGRMAMARILGPYVRQEYGMLLQKRAARKLRRSARKHAAALKSAELPETDADGVDGVVREDDALAFALA